MPATEGPQSMNHESHRNGGLRPDPAGPEVSDSGGRELRLERLEGPEVPLDLRLDCCCQGTLPLHGTEVLRAGAPITKEIPDKTTQLRGRSAGPTRLPPIHRVQSSGITKRVNKEMNISDCKPEGNSVTNTYKI